MKKRLSILALFLILLSGCGGYKIRPLKPLRKYEADYEETKNGITLYVKRLDREEAHECFSGRQIPFKQVVPLMLTLKNNSSHSISFSARHIGLTLFDYQAMIRLMHRSVAAPLLAGTGMAVATDIATSATGDRLARTVGAAASAGSLIGGAGASIAASSDNDSFAVDLRNKLLDRVSLWPGEKMTKVIFADKSQFRRQFKIRISQSIENAQGFVMKKKVYNFDVKI